jgi:hypothetical protein
LFAASQIVDRPTSDLRPRFYWGVYGSVVPSWSVPGSMGTWFFESVSSANPPKMNGRDLRVGLVRARQVGFEMGVSLVRKTVTSFTSFATVKQREHSDPLDLHRARRHEDDRR